MKTFVINLLMALTFSFISFKAMAGNEDRHNLSNNAIGSIFGMSNLEYSYKLTDRLTVGIEGSTGKIDLGDIKIKGSSYGFIARYYLSSAFKNSSWYLLASYTQDNYEGSVVSDGVKYEGDIEGPVVGCGGGYHVFWDSFNMNFGLFAKSGEEIKLKDSSGNEYDDGIDNRIGAEFNIGWKF